MRNLLSILAIAVLWTLTAHATTPTQVQNVDDPTVHPYQFAQANCSTAGACTIFFPAITTGRTLVQHVSCFFSLPTGSSINSAYLYSQVVNPRNFLQVFTYGSSGGFTSLGINAETYLFFGKGDQPIVVAESSIGAVTDLACTVSGYYN